MAILERMEPNLSRKSTTMEMRQPEYATQLTNLNFGLAGIQAINTGLRNNMIRLTNQPSTATVTAASCAGVNIAPWASIASSWEFIGFAQTLVSYSNGISWFLNGAKSFRI